MSEKDDIIKAAQGIIAEYGGMRLTLRQLFYRLVSNQVIVNNEKQYHKLIRIMADARREKRIAYTAIEDRTRRIQTKGRRASAPGSFFRGYYDSLKNLHEYYSMPKWWGQPTQVVVFVEKEALSSLFEDVCDDLQVDFVVCRGYPSLTLMHDVAEHIKNKSDEVEKVVFVYFGDYDPSGADIERHVEEELSGNFELEFEMRRVAITREQIEEYNITPAPAKASDSRTKGFEEKEGVAWQVELDAIEPKVLQSMIRDCILEHYDNDINDERLAETDRRKRKLKEWTSRCLSKDFEPPSWRDEE